MDMEYLSKDVLIVAKCNVNLSAEWHIGVDHGVLIVAKCNVNIW